jgi:hypothetical protein
MQPAGLVGPETSTMERRKERIAKLATVYEMYHRTLYGYLTDASEN